MLFNVLLYYLLYNKYDSQHTSYRERFESKFLRVYVS